MTFIRRNNKLLLFLSLLGIFTLGFSSVTTFFLISYERAIRDFGIAEWTIFFICASFTMAFAMTPTTFISLVSGFFLGFLCIPGVLISYFIASMIGYKLSGVVDNGRFLNSMKEIKGAENMLANLKKGEPWFVILCRLSPFLPFAIMNVFLSAMKIRFSTFMWAGFAGMLPRTLLFIWIGMQFQQIRILLEEGEKHSYAQVSVITLVVLTIVGFYYYFRRVMMKKAG
jgi:uncharacterized membrane protein YdjX (TVP38/TMEM64 family)